MQPAACEAAAGSSRCLCGEAGVACHPPCLSCRARACRGRSQVGGGGGRAGDEQRGGGGVAAGQLCGRGAGGAVRRQGLCVLLRHAPAGRCWRLRMPPPRLPPRSACACATAPPLPAASRLCGARRDDASAALPACSCSPRRGSSSLRLSPPSASCSKAAPTARQSTRRPGQCPRAAAPRVPASWPTAAARFARSRALSPGATAAPATAHVGRRGGRTALATRF